MTDNFMEIRSSVFDSAFSQYQLSPSALSTTGISQAPLPVFNSTVLLCRLTQATLPPSTCDAISDQDVEMQHMPSFEATCVSLYPWSCFKLY